MRPNLMGSRKLGLSNWPALRPQRAGQSGVFVFLRIEWFSSASWTLSVTRRFDKHYEPTGPKPSPPASEPTMGDSSRAKRPVRHEDGRRAFRLPAPVRPSPTGGLHGRDVQATPEARPRAGRGEAGHAPSPRSPLRAKRHSEPVYVFEPLAAHRVACARERRKMVDWAECVREVLDTCYSAAKKGVLVMDNLNTHGLSSLYPIEPLLGIRACRSAPPGRAARDSLYAGAWKLAERSGDRTVRFGAAGPKPPNPRPRQRKGERPRGRRNGTLGRPRSTGNLRARRHESI